MVRRFACSAGWMPTTTPSSTATQKPRATVAGEKSSGPMPNCASWPPTNGMATVVMPMPSRPPTVQSSTDSPSTSQATFASVKPRVFSTASSGMRSRSAWFITTAVSSRMVKKTAERMPLAMRPMSPTWALKERAISSSVMVLTGFMEFSNSASMAEETSGARSGSSMRTVHQPTEPWPKARASSK